MPKKFSGENTKAAAARARKNAAKEEEEQRKQKEKEDAYWRDDDKIINKKLQRREEQEKKKVAQMQKKAELKNLIKQEENALNSLTKQPTSKVLRAQALEEQERRNAAAAAAAKKKELATHLDKPLEENINRIKVDGYEARSVTEAISILSVKSQEVDKHPEKRMKASYASFEAANMPRIKEENPTLKMSQLKQILWKEWARSPQNPLNQQSQ